MADTTPASELGKLGSCCRRHITSGSKPASRSTSPQRAQLQRAQLQRAQLQRAQLQRAQLQRAKKDYGIPVSAPNRLCQAEGHRLPRRTAYLTKDGKPVHYAL